jgi:hypothetical protein
MSVEKTKELEQLESHQQIINKANAELEHFKERKTLRNTMENLGGSIEKMEKENKKMSKQEENWMMMTTLQIPWKDANAIEDPEDREFLLIKVKEVQKYMMEEQEQMQKRQNELMQNQGQPQKPQSSIITPQEMGL